MKRGHRGVVLLAVIIFVALLLPLVTLVLTSLNTEAVSTAEAIKGHKLDLASQKALNDAISLVVQQKSLPDYYSSANQPATAIVVLDPVSGFRRDQVPDSGVVGAAGLDDILGTGDDYWTSPRGDRSVLPTDVYDNPRNYEFDFSFSQMHSPTYLGQPSLLSSTNRYNGTSPNTGETIWLFNPFLAVAVDDDADGIDDGYDLNDAGSDPFDGKEGQLHGNGGFPNADEPRLNGAGSAVERSLDNGNLIRDYMLNSRIAIYESVFTDLDRGPVPTDLLKSYADVTDEAGRINLNIFAKKVRVLMPEAADVDYNLEGLATNDFNYNEQLNELGFKWIDNPLFPDRLTNQRWNWNIPAGTLSNDGDIDFGTLDPSTGIPDPTPDGYSWPDLGENVQHFYLGDTDGDGISQGNEAARHSVEMLTSLPGVDLELALNILEYLNPSQDTLNAIDPGYADGSVEPNIDPTIGAAGYRYDVANVTPPLTALGINLAGGTVGSIFWDFAASDEDDMPLPQPFALSSLDQLLNVPGMTRAKFNRLKDYLTIHSYDTNVIGTYITDVGPDADLVNAYEAGDPFFFGQVRRTVPDDMRDTDNVNDLRYDVTATAGGFSLEDYRDRAEEMYAYIREHLPSTNFRKITLPAVDRTGRSGASDHMTPNDDPRYDPTGGGLLVPHRDSEANPYNVGAFGHQFPTSDEAFTNFAGYPALNPEFSLDSCLSIVLYRNGTPFTADDYTYDWNGVNMASHPASPGIGNLFGGGAFFFIERIFGIFGGGFDFGPNNNPPDGFDFATLANTNNANPVVTPHGPGVFTAANLLNPGTFDSAADLLQVPLYEFSSMSVSLMSDPPSDYRDDTVNPNGIVSYYATFSDVVPVSWYFDNVTGPDGNLGTADDPAQDVVLYMLYFNHANRTGVFPSAGGPYDAGSLSPDTVQIPLTAQQIRSVSPVFPGMTGNVTIQAYDNFNNLDVLGPDFTNNPAFASLLAPLGGVGSLGRNFSYQQVPYPLGGAVTDDGNWRPNEGNAWDTGVAPADWPGWAWTGEGDPYATGRILAYRWDDAANEPEDPELRADDITKVFLQYNTEAAIPFAVNILPVRTGGDTYDIYSSYGGADTTGGGSYLLFDWEYRDTLGPDDDPDDFDGTWPTEQPGQLINNPIQIRVNPEGNTVTLHMYDLRTFVDSSGLPIASGTPALPGNIYAGGRVQTTPSDGGTFPVDYGGGYPPVPTGGYAFDSAVISPIETAAGFQAQLASHEVSVFDNDTSVEVEMSAAGGDLNYNWELRVLDATLGNGVGGPYQGPDGAGPIATFPGLGSPPRPSRVTPPGFDYSAAELVPGTLLVVAGSSSSPEWNTFFDPSGLPNNTEYWLRLRVTENGGATDTVFSKLVKDDESSSSTGTAIPPEMNASITLRELGDSRLGFTASASVDGGRDGYGYYWVVTRPKYNGTGNHVLDSVIPMETVDAAAPIVNLDSLTTGGGAVSTTVQMRSNDASPSFEFSQLDNYDNETGAAGADGIPDAQGVYFVHCFVLDRNNLLPSSGQSFIAHDVAQVTLSNLGTGAGGVPDTSGIARTPMAVLAANPPGNASITAGTNNSAAGGANPPYIGSATIDPAIEPDVAANGQAIVIRGFNFDPVASNNTVHFAGGVSATGAGVTAPSGVDILNIGGSPYGQQELTVRVPDGARTGFITVQTPGGTSDRRYIFQTGFNVTFDLIGSLSVNDAAYLQYDLDFQGDGKIDYSYSSLSNPSGGRQLIGSNLGITHDYAGDGIGNYNATLTVKDLVSGRTAVSHQLVMIHDLANVSGTNLVLASGFIGNIFLAGTPSFTDGAASFISAGVLPGDLVTNLNTGATTSVVSVISQNEVGCGSLSAPQWNIGDAYSISRFVDSNGAYGILADIWPDIDTRGASFNPQPGSGLAFRSAVGGINTALARRKWQIDLNGTSGTRGGEQVTSGNSTSNEPSGTVLRDTNNNFAQAGSRGVSVGDLVLNITDGSTANVLDVVSGSELRLSNPGDPSFGTGLVNGTGVNRTGVVDGNSVNQVIDQLAAPYDFVGDINGPAQGGIMVGDTVLQTRDGVQIGTWTVSSTANSPGILDVVNNTFTGTQTATVNAFTDNGGGNWDITLNRFANNSLIGLVLTNVTDGNSTWTITAFNGGNDLTVQLIAPGAGLGVFNIGDLVSINAVPAEWVVDDIWTVNIPANQFRIGYEYEIFTENGFSGNAWADATFADFNTPIEFHIEMNYPFDLSAAGAAASFIEVDWDNDSVVDDIFFVADTTRGDGTQNGIEVENAVITHSFGAGPELNGAGYTVGRYWVNSFAAGQTGSERYGGGAGFALPVVRVGRDDYDTDLGTLNVAQWNNSRDHKVTMTALYQTFATLTDNPLPGSTNNAVRQYETVDQLYVPRGDSQFATSLTNWVSYSAPFVTSNISGITQMLHQSVHGEGSSFNWLSDANANTLWNNDGSESPQDGNPSSTYEYAVNNGFNNWAEVPLNVRGASFPQAAPNVGRPQPNGIFDYYTARRGVYNGWAWSSDVLPSSQRSFSFDSQAVFVGDRNGSSSPERRALGVDIYIDSIVASNSDPIRFTAFPSGGANEFNSYSYRWFVEYDNGGGFQPVDMDNNAGTSPPVSASISGPILVPYEDIQDEAFWVPADSGAGAWRVWCEVSDGSGVVNSAMKTFTVVEPPHSVHVMATPPSGSTGEFIEFWVSADGGTPGYDLEIDYDGDAVYDDVVTVGDGSIHIFGNVYNTPGTYSVEVRSTDDSGNVATDTTVVRVAESIPLWGDLIVNPPSGVAPFIAQVHYAVSGGRRLADGGYNVNLALLDSSGSSQGSVSRTDADSFGGDGPDDPRLPGGNDEPVTFVVPSAGTYTVQMTVSDNSGGVVTVNDTIFADGYMTPIEYGNTAPRVVTDREGRPMHAVRIWTDPHLTLSDDTTQVFGNKPDSEGRGGRLMEADLQVFGDIVGVDTNQAFRSIGNYASKDPLDVPQWQVSYSQGFFGNANIEDYYDTYTEGRVNINTASEEVLTALFRKIITNRAYDYDVVDDIDNNGVNETYHFVRDQVNDSHMTEAAARVLARKVIRYRTLYYDQNKPTPADADGNFGYTQSANAAAASLNLGNFRVDHLPMIGPFDGTNPHQYGIANRDGALGQANTQMLNTWDNMAGSYYNLDNGDAANMFYSPSDMAVVREPLAINIGIDVDGDGVPEPGFNFNVNESKENYAKYLNDVASNSNWENNRYAGGGGFGTWAATGQYPSDNSGNNYSRWSFDARHYFTYSSGNQGLTVGTDGSFSLGALTGVEDVVDGRNKVGVFESNGVTAGTFIPNPPFQNIFDLYKVIDDSAGNQSFPLTGTLDATITLNGNDRSSGLRRYSGPSAFRYEEYWDAGAGEFVVRTNWLDDIAPFITCRSYVYRVDSSAAITASGGTSSALLDTSTLARDRSKTVILDAGPLANNRGVDQLSDLDASRGLISPARSASYKILWFSDNSE
ncbi:MAG: hypothetical protein H7A35_02470 [Planctomycetales bacterium]|nr:hypothetical protein [bacterium]UNM08923.1 MAG: hypothetical protein H7A35_02470 [Planctomycetales bacterium]